jgi:hypothetical protein
MYIDIYIILNGYKWMVYGYKINHKWGYHGNFIGFTTVIHI